MANMFNQMKDMYKMQREAKKMQNQLKEVKITGESKRGEVRMYFTAAQDLENVTFDDEILDPENSDRLAEAIKEAYKDYQKKLQKQMMKNFDMNQLRGMLGG